MADRRRHRVAAKPLGRKAGRGHCGGRAHRHRNHTGRGRQHRQQRVHPPAGYAARIPVEKQKHYRAVHPRLGVQAGHGGSRAGFRRDDRRAGILLRRRADRQRGFRKIQAHLPLRLGLHPRLAGYGAGAEQQLQHLVYPSGADPAALDFLQLYQGVRLHPAHRH